jgi:hypothetical protein
MVRSLIILVLVLLASGCSGPPQTIDLEGFDAMQTVLIQDVADQWCRANGYCPTIVAEGGEGHIRIEQSSIPAEGEDARGGHTPSSGQTIFVESWILSTFPEALWVTVAHEFGHLQGIEHHGGSECTMSVNPDAPAYELRCEN